MMKAEYKSFLGFYYIIVCVDEEGTVLSFWNGARFGKSAHKAFKFKEYDEALSEIETQLMNDDVAVLRMDVSR